MYLIHSVLNNWCDVVHYESSIQKYNEKTKHNLCRFTMFFVIVNNDFEMVIILIM